MRARPGHLSAMTFFTASMAYTFYAAPSLPDPIWRYACAGTAATLFCEVVMHAVDTVNMRSKIINGPKLYVFELLKHEGALSLFRGIQPVLYGYFIASLVYFYVYAHSKNILSGLVVSTEESQVWKQMAVSFVGSGFAEFLSLAFYYPFDLIKTRMQVSQLGNHHYNGVLDATLKIMNENERRQNAAGLDKLKERLSGIRNLYRGGLVFGLSYVAYTAVQFSLFESILLYLEGPTPPVSSS